MKKLLTKLLIIVLLFLCACTNKESYPIFMDIEISKTNANELREMDYDFYLPEIIEANNEIHSDYLLYKGINVGSISFKNNNEIDINGIDATISYLEIYVDIYPEEINIEGYELSESIKENCKILKGKYKEAIGNSCIIEKDNIVYILESNIAKDWDKLNRIEIYGR